MKAAEPGLRTRHLLWFAQYSQASQGAGTRRSGNVNQAHDSRVFGARLPLSRPGDAQLLSNRYWKTPTREQLTQKVRNER
jgi:hypothetical protein